MHRNPPAANPARKRMHGEMRRLPVSIIVFSVAIISFGAATETIGDYTWMYRDWDENTVEIFKNTWYDWAVSPNPTGVVTIPSTLGGKRVTRIGAEAFSHCDGMTGVRIPNSVNYIGNSAFSGCSGLKSITIPDSITHIHDGTFHSCRGLTSIVIPSSVTNIDEFAFYGCNGLASVTIPDSVMSIGYEAFMDCSGLTNVMLSGGPISIGQGAFARCGGLTSMTIPSGVTHIGPLAFSYCDKLESVTIMGSETVIWEVAFAYCSGLKVVHFKGTPPPCKCIFSDASNEVIGTYLPEYRSEWETVIDDGYWHGLKMQESVANKPVVTNGGCNVAAGELTIAWGGEDAPMPSGMTYEVRRGFSENYDASEVLTNGYDGLSYVDKDFFSTGGVSRIWYWVKPEHSLFEPSEPLVTKNRFLLSVGYDEYKNNWCNPLSQSLSDATELKRLCVERGGFSSVNARLLSNSAATTNGIRDSIADFARRTQPGDMFVFYIATHGGDHHVKIFGSNDVVKHARLCAYDTHYPVEDLQADVREFPNSVAVVGIIMACHSQSMSGGVDERTGFEKVNEWLANGGFGQCLGNVAWITSCASSQGSYNSINYTMFGQSFIHDGFMNGYADAELYGVEFDGVEYKGGNFDGVITLGELGRYAGTFAKGISDDCPSDVKLENAGLLDRIIIAKGIVPSSLNRPEPPVGVVATQGTFDFRTRVSWSASETATGYRVYRYPQGMPLAGKWVETTFGATSADDFPTSFADKLGVAMSRSILGVKYLYYVKAINPVGVSEPSSLVEGWRGTTSFLSYLAGIIGAAPASITTEEYDAVENATAANGCRTVGECYALGINPEDPNDDLKINHFEMKDGKPVITLNHAEDGSGNSFMPRVKTLGKANLSDAEWREVSESGDSSLRFFKVEVEMP